MESNIESPLFHEVQRFSQRWFWIVLTLSMLAILGVFAHGLIEQLVFGRLWGDRPLSDTALWLVAVVVFIFCAGLVFLFYNLRLETTVYDNRIELNFKPVWRKVIDISQVKECEARVYSPLKEYGGWGIKYGFKNGWAYNIMGNEGVQLVLNDGTRLLVGSQQSNRLADTINANRK